MWIECIMRNQACILRIVHLVIMYDYFYVLLDLICQYLKKDFCIYAYEVIGL